MSQELATITETNYAKEIMAYLKDGDITKLPLAAQVRLYEEMCQAIGMTSQDRPFSFVYYGGKNVTYLTANACNHFAAMKGIQRDIVTKPEIVDIEGKRAIFVHCRGTLGARTEEDYYWREIKTDSSIMVQMSKAQSAARRRVTMLFMSSTATRGVMSEDDIDHLGLDRATVTDAPVERIVEASRAMVTEEKPEMITPEQIVEIRHLCGILGLATPRSMPNWTYGRAQEAIDGMAAKVEGTWPKEEATA